MTLIKNINYFGSMKLLPVVIKEGAIEVKGELYHYEVSKLENHLGANRLEIWNENGELATGIIYDENSVEDLARIIILQNKNHLS